MIHGWSAFGGPTMIGRTLGWKEELGRWLRPFLDRLGHKSRRQMCPLYVLGLIGPGDRKSIQPMAERLALGEYDQLHHFIAAGVWDVTPVERELLVQADRLVGGSDAVLVIDDTAIPKKGTHSVGVAAQYASALGKTATCQTLVSLTLARGEVPVMLALRLFLPESWTSKRGRLERAGVPAEYRTARSKPEMALAEIDRVIAAGVRFGCVLADAAYASGEGHGIGPVLDRRRARSSGLRGNVVRAPMPGQEFLNALGGMIRQAGEHVGEPSLRVNIVELGSRDQRVDGSRATAAFVRAGEGPVATADRDGTQLALGGVVRHAQAAIVEEAGERAPALEAVVDRFAGLAVPGDPGALHA